MDRNHTLDKVITSRISRIHRVQLGWYYLLFLWAILPDMAYLSATKAFRIVLPALTSMLLVASRANWLFSLVLLIVFVLPFVEVVLSSFLSLLGLTICSLVSSTIVVLILVLFLLLKRSVLFIKNLLRETSNRNSIWREFVAFGSPLYPLA